jgi:hypothetical protein
LVLPFHPFALFGEFASLGFQASFVHLHFMIPAGSLEIGADFADFGQFTTGGLEGFSQFIGHSPGYGLVGMSALSWRRSVAKGDLEKTGRVALPESTTFHKFTEGLFEGFGAARHRMACEGAVAIGSRAVAHLAFDFGVFLLGLFSGQVTAFHGSFDTFFE